MKGKKCNMDKKVSHASDAKHIRWIFICLLPNVVLGAVLVYGLLVGEKRRKGREGAWQRASEKGETGCDQSKC